MLYDLPYPDDTFDFIHISFFVYVFRNEEWPTAIKEAIRVIKPGGMLQFVEAGHMLFVETNGGGFFFFLADIFYINYQKIVPLLFTSIEAQVFCIFHLTNIYLKEPYTNRFFYLFIKKTRSKNLRQTKGPSFSKQRSQSEAT